MPAIDTQGSLRRSAVISAALLAAYVAAVAWVLYEQATAWPHEGSWIYAVLVLACPGIVFQAFSLAYTRLTGRPLTRRALTRLATIPLGLVLAGVLASWASALAMRNFEQAYAPFVARVGADPAGACRSAARHFEIPPVAAYNLQAHRGNPAARLRHDGKRFVLSFDGGSIDIDGSTIYYDSGAGTWRKFHNDNDTEREVHARRIEGLAECVLRAAGAAR